MWCAVKGVNCYYCGIFGECRKGACDLPNAEPSSLGTSSSYLVNPQIETEVYKSAFKEGYREGFDDGIELNKAFHNEKCAEFDKLSYDYNKLLYIIRCNMTSITRYVRNENETYDIKYKELAEKAVENILEAINHKEKE